jgi:MFS family permease
MPLALSIIITGAGSIPYAFLSSQISYIWLVYPLACVQGVGIAMMLNTSTSLISDVVSKDSASSAFVYGIYSFLDKISNGVMLYYLVKLYSDNGFALKLIVSIVPTVSAIGTAILTWIGITLYQERMARLSVQDSAPRFSQLTE